MSAQATAPDDPPPAPQKGTEPIYEQPDNDPLPGRPSKSKIDRSADLSRLSKHSYLAGVVGALTILGMGYLGARREALTKGWHLFAPPSENPSPHLVVAFVLVVCAAVMFAIELGIRLTVDRGHVISVSPRVRDRQVGAFLWECVKIYVVEVCLLATCFGMYKVAGEYGFSRGAEYYQPWFAVMPFIMKLYLYGGLPYVLLTRALQHDGRADRKQAALTVMKAARLLAIRFKLVRVQASEEVAPLDRYDRSAMLGLGVKFFFVPLMTVFFTDQFSHLVRNWDFVLKNLLVEHKPWSVGDFYNVSFTVIFSIDVGVAWGGYVLSSRWIKNTLFSVEPTFLGWAVALMSYPPFNHNFGLYFQTPNENGFMTIGIIFAVNILAICSVLSFVIYTSATICFGLRFSNLTHRGIITTGPYSVIRHPAYAAKNFSWWCVMLPYALFDLTTQLRTLGTAETGLWSQLGSHWHQWTTPLVQIVGLFAMSGIYYMRALTEERHLGRDPEYRIYANRVRYRFIPGYL